MPSMRMLGGVVGLLLAMVGAPAPSRAQHAVPVPPVGPQPLAGAQHAVPLLGDQADGSRARPVHRIPLRDAEGEVIRPTDRPLLPFSARHTCGADCHNVATVSRGWHFTTAVAGSSEGRRGEPWILVDVDTATQLPLSYHEWAGAFRPGQIDITPWRFARLFGGRTPGGIGGEREPSPVLRVRWAVSGELEPNCLACHDASPAYDHAEYARQVELENLRWAVAGASGLALVTGAAREMPNTFDFLLPVVEDALLPRMPSVAYAPERFLPGAKVIFDIVREVPARRCYFCHSSADIEHTGQGRWNADEDIHLAQGMTCVDCHRNGLDHAMTRGYETEGAQHAVPEPSAGSQPTAAVSCRGCHLAGEAERVFARGRVGAPYPRHAGLPPIHLQKLSCTTCHSGPVPGATTRRVKTSQAHRLGGLNVNRSPDALPHLYYPVFARQEDGTTTPNRLLWPAFWGRMSNGTIRPLAPERVKNVMSKAGVKLKRSPDGTWPSFDSVTLAGILALLQGESQAEGTPVYVAGGKLYRLDKAGNITSEDHPLAQPYLWPIAHDVRPASLALGAKGCQDCHSTGAPIFFGQVAVDSPLTSARSESWTMVRFQKNLDTAYVADFARSFRYRPWLKGTVTGAVASLLVLMLAYVMPALARLSAATGANRGTRVFINLAGVVSCGTSVASGYPALLSGQTLTGYRLMIHVGAAGALATSAVLVTLFWAHRNRLGRADWNRVRRPFGRSERCAANPYTVVLRKLFFWVAVASAVPAVASATMAMFPILASVRQALLFQIHRYAVVPLATAAVFFAGFAFVSWLRGHGDGREEAARVVSGS